MVKMSGWKTIPARLSTQPQVQARANGSDALPGSAVATTTSRVQDPEVWYRTSFHAVNPLRSSAPSGT